LLALATIVLILFDPMLVRSVGFQLSVAASLGIVVGARRIAAHLVGPMWLRETMGVTVAAQLGVLPVQLVTFGSLPLASFPANLAAAPVAGPAMVWGLNAGLLGGVVGEPMASVLHVPTRLLVGWVAAVARWGASAGLPEIDRAEAAPVLALLLGAAALLVAWPHARLALLVGLAAGTYTIASAGAGTMSSGDDLEVVSTQPMVVVIDRPPAAWTLGQLRIAGIRHVDVLITRSRSAQAAETVAALTSRVDIELVLAPGRLRGSVVVVVDEPVRVGPLWVRREGQRLVVGPPG
ncbi:MAG: ComEC/Rec2 family competence protein, partial [Actinomycetota bacterium]|nr:ComEC/Rec2 family competence protein [Actinomycetota bacterium]